MEQESLIESVKKLREEIRQQLLEVRADLEVSADELRESLLSQESKRRSAAATEARERAASIQQIRDEVRAQLSVDMEIFYAQVEEARSERRRALFGESGIVAFPQDIQEEEDVKPADEKPKRRTSRKRSTAKKTKTEAGKDA